MFTPEDVEAPKVTFAVFFYNQEKFVQKAVEGALSQTFQNLEIILSDDASSDSTFDLIQSIVSEYSGPHKVYLNRNVINLGLSDHVNHVFDMAKGEIIVIAAGDDISLPSRVSDTVEVFERHKYATAVSFTDIVIDEEGRQKSHNEPSRKEMEVDLDKFLQAGPRAQGRLGISAASRAIRRNVYEHFGSLSTDCPAEDSPYLLRSLYIGNLVVCGWPAIKYRSHSKQMSTERNIVGMNPELFRSQYLSDLNIALNVNLSKNQEMELRRSFYERETAFIMRRLRFNGNAPDISILFRVIGSSQYSLREKIGLIIRFFTRRGVY